MGIRTGKQGLGCRDMEDVEIRAGKTGIRAWRDVGDTGIRAWESQGLGHGGHGD